MGRCLEGRKKKLEFICRTALLFLLRKNGEGNFKSLEKTSTNNLSILGHVLASNFIRSFILDNQKKLKTKAEED